LDKLYGVSEVEETSGSSHQIIAGDKVSKSGRIPKKLKTKKETVKKPKTWELG
jgi:hypothetical protein